jgi:para-aminobenzoate synthetase component 1
MPTGHSFVSGGKAGRLVWGEVDVQAPFFERAAELGEYGFLLDSARALSGLGRYSFLGGRPWLVFTARARTGEGPRAAARLASITLEFRDPECPDTPGRIEQQIADPFETLQALLNELSLPADVRSQLPLPFIGGAVGYVAYDAAHFIEQLPNHAPAAAMLPELCLMFVDEVLAHDHATGLSYLIVTARAETAARAAAEATERWKRSLMRLREPPARSQPAPPSAADHERGPISAQSSAAEYAQMVVSAQRHIAAGDAFEICAAQHFTCAYQGDGWPLYRALRAVNPAPFACYLRFPWAELVSSSPERFLRLSFDGQAQSRPIKGTRPRGATPQADASLRAELASSEKDRAENIMIVDLVRNDFGRVCEVGSIQVPELMVIEEHASVFQMVSSIEGRVTQSGRALELFRACFPPGSMTGAPKIEAMKIIERLETCKRGLYAGAVGYFDLGGGMDFSVLIRSFVLAQGRCYFSAGGAVVADSDPDAEYRESMDKVRALLLALERVDRTREV